ncbi:MAG: four helix bundle protein [Verrucomicrobia bacterium]|nr:MAG: four helix bundle protein [Verrucomicrobiota bacterium]
MGYNVKKGKEQATPDGSGFRTFEDLEVYKAAREFRKKMYGVARRLPDFEKFGLASQIRRAAVSLTNNMAEGHGRYHFADQVRFFLGSRGSLQELVDDINVCNDEKYLEGDEITELKGEAWRVLGLINGYLRYLRDRKANDRSAVREGSDGEIALLDEALRSGGPF